MNRCSSPYSRSPRTTSARYAFRPQFMSCRWTPETQPVTALKIRDEIRRRSGSRRLRLPAGDEVEALVELGEQLRDLGRVVLEVAVDRDDHVALRLGEARRRARPPCRSCGAGGRRRRCRCAACSRVSAAYVPSVEPSSTKIASQGCRAAGAPSRARRRGARRSAPRCERGRRPRSRARAYPGGGGRRRAAAVVVVRRGRRVGAVVVVVRGRRSVVVAAVVGRRRCGRRRRCRRRGGASWRGRRWWSSAVVVVRRSSSAAVLVARAVDGRRSSGDAARSSRARAVETRRPRRRAEGRRRNRRWSRCRRSVTADRQADAGCGERGDREREQQPSPRVASRRDGSRW